MKNDNGRKVDGIRISFRQCQEEDKGPRNY